MYILGIDQGIAHLGYAVMKDKKLIEYGCITTNSNDIIEQRFFSLYNDIKQLIIKYQPEAVCCEKLFYTSPKAGNRNKSASIIYTNMITGVLASLCGEFEIELRQFVPSKVKKALCNNGKASKEDIESRIASLYRVETETTKYEHVCDSIAIAYTYFIENDADKTARNEFEAYRDDKWKKARKKNEIEQKKYEKYLRKVKREKKRLEKLNAKKV